MTLPHFFAGAPDRGVRLTLDPDDAHHATRSLRLGLGDRITSSDGNGAVAVCRIVDAARDAVVVEVEEREVRPPPSPRLALLLAPPKGERLAWAVQKLTEVGTDRIVLVESGRGVRRWSADRAARVVERVRGVAREAAKQSRRAFLPRVEGPLRWSDALGEAASRGLMVLLWEEAARGLADLLPEEPPDEIAVVVGPEGGIAEEEAREAERRGALLASLGTNILRTETAALAGASVVLSRWGRLGPRGDPGPGSGSRRGPAPGSIEP